MCESETQLIRIIDKHALYSSHRDIDEQNNTHANVQMHSFVRLKSHTHSSTKAKSETFAKIDGLVVCAYVSYCLLRFSAFTFQLSAHLTLTRTLRIYILGYFNSCVFVPLQSLSFSVSEKQSLNAISLRWKWCEKTLLLRCRSPYTHTVMTIWNGPKSFATLAKLRQLLLMGGKRWALQWSQRV